MFPVHWLPPQSKRAALLYYLNHDARKRNLRLFQWYQRKVSKTICLNLKRSWRFPFYHQQSSHYPHSYLTNLLTFKSYYYRVLYLCRQCCLFEDHLSNNNNSDTIVTQSLHYRLTCHLFDNILIKLLIINQHNKTREIQQIFINNTKIIYHF